MLNKESLPYLLPIHMTIDLGTGVWGQGVFFGDGDGKVPEIGGQLTWALVEEGQNVFLGDERGIDD
jgi:hypothetical protein